MTYGQIKAKLLRENRLLDTAKFLKESEDQTYYADRHVLHSDREKFKGLDMPIRDLGILLGLELLREWTRAADEIQSLFISKPYLSIESEWLTGVNNAAPPSVVVHLAKSALYFRSMKTAGAVPKDPDFEVSVEADFSGLNFAYVESAYDDDCPAGYTWCIRVNNGRFP